MSATTTTQLLADSEELSTQLTWKPAKIGALEGLQRLTSEEKEQIFKKLPRSKDNEIYADAVFEGGGVKGIAFLGALRCCSAFKTTRVSTLDAKRHHRMVSLYIQNPPGWATLNQSFQSLDGLCIIGFPL